MSELTPEEVSDLHFFLSSMQSPSLMLKIDLNLNIPQIHIPFD